MGLNLKRIAALRAIYLKVPRLVGKRYRFSNSMNYQVCSTCAKADSQATAVMALTPE